MFVNDLEGAKERTALKKRTEKKVKSEETNKIKHKTK